MRRIKSQEQLKKEKDRNVKIMSVFMLAILVLGTIGFSFSSFLAYGSDSGDNSGNNDGQIEIKVKDRTLTIGDEKFKLGFSKEQVLGIDVNLVSKINDIFGNYIYLDVKNEEIENEIIGPLKVLNFVRDGCYQNCEENERKISCDIDDALIWIESSENRVYQEEKCIFIEGDLKTADAFLYEFFGV